MIIIIELIYDDDRSRATGVAAGESATGVEFSGRAPCRTGISDGSLVAEIGAAGHRWCAGADAVGTVRDAAVSSDCRCCGGRRRRGPRDHGRLRWPAIGAAKDSRRP